MPLEVRPARPADSAAVAAIFAHYVAHSMATFVEHAPDAGEWRRRIEAAALPFLVAVEGGEVIGWARLTPWRDKGGYRHTAEDTVYVAPQAVGREVGRALLAELAAQAGEAGIREIVAVVADTGDRAPMRLHLAAGFTERGRLTGVGRKQGRWLDTVVLQHSVGRAPLECS